MSVIQEFYLNQETKARIIFNIQNQHLEVRLVDRRREVWWVLEDNLQLSTICWAQAHASKVAEQVQVCLKWDKCSQTKKIVKEVSLICQFINLSFLPQAKNTTIKIRAQRNSYHQIRNVISIKRFKLRITDLCSQWSFKDLLLEIEMQDQMTDLQ